MIVQGGIQLCSIVSRNDRLAAQRLDDEIVMANLETGEYYGLESCGRRIWELLSQPTSVTNICAQLMKEYSVEPSQCEQEAMAFIDELFREGLIHLDN
jgi:hypothetical protein